MAEESRAASLAQTSIQAAGPRSTGEPTLRGSNPDTSATYLHINNRETIINMARYQSILRLFLLVVLALIAISHGEESEGAVDVDDNAAEAAAEAESDSADAESDDDEVYGEELSDEQIYGKLVAAIEQYDDLSLIHI